jgi:kumamolisin
MGVTIFNCSFDNGSNEYQNDGNAHVAYPASDIWVTACGGTRITNVSASSFTENTWNDDAYETGAATGGGISDAIDLPDWQRGVVGPSVNPSGRIGRGLPDIAGNASYYSGYLLQIDGKSDYQINGTSSVAPLYAGLIAIINAALGQPVGYLNPTLYELAKDPAYADAIRDISDGISNAVHWKNQNGTIGGPSRGYESGPGWDACTGLGVLDGTRLLNALQNLQAKPWP